MFSSLFVSHPVFYDEISFYYRFHFLKMMSQPMPYQLLLQLLELFNLHLQQVSWVDDFSSLKGNFMRNFVKKNFLKYSLSSLANSSEGSFNYFNFSEQNYVKVVKFIPTLVKFKWSHLENNSSHLEKTNIDNSGIPIEERIEFF